LLATLTKIARDKTFECLLKQEKGKHTPGTQLLNKCKQVSDVTEVSENIWKVTSQHQDDAFYTVHRLLTSRECKN